MTYTIKTANADFVGTRMGVKFAKGVGTTEDQALAAQLAGLGYQVDPSPVPAAKEPPEEKPGRRK